MPKPVVFLELNEVNISLIERYLSAGIRLPGWSALLKYGYRKTYSETEYSLIEPWIQWVSVHTGLSFEQHGIFRLGDMASSQTQQIFELLEKDGFKVGCLSPMNTRNNLQEPAFFIPDPWTKTPTDGSWYSNFLWQALEQAVNDNAQQKLTLKTMFKLLLSVAYLVAPSRLYKLTKKLKKLRKKRYGKALFLDLLLSEIFMTLNRRNRPHFSVLFLNAFAHIQHHYYYSSRQIDENNFKNPKWYVDEETDPILDAIIEYDDILLQWVKDDVNLFVATGLSQVPFPEPQFYYRLKDHANFMKLIGINYDRILPRMTRDFLVQFPSNNNRDEAMHLLSSLKIKDERVFGEIQVRDNELFVTLTYPKEIDGSTVLEGAKEEILNLKDHVVFVALKNGHHDGQGYLCTNNQALVADIEPEVHVTEIASILQNAVRATAR